MDRRLDPARDIDWQGDFVWVQRAPVLTVLERCAGWVHVRHPAGGELTLSRAAVEAEYLPIAGGTMLKPRDEPIKAHCFDQTVCLELPCGTVRLEPGDAVLNHGGRFRVVRSAVYDRDYLVLAIPGASQHERVPIAGRA